MKRNLSLASALLCLLFLPGVCSAQFQNHFNLYSTQSLDNDGVTIHQTTTLDGYTVVPPGMPPYAVHTPGQCSTCHITYSTTITHQELGNLIEEDDTGAAVVCSVAGTFFQVPEIVWSIHIGISNYILESWDASNCYWLIYCPNGITAASCPTPVTITDIGGMLFHPPCNAFNYLQDRKLVVNYKCFPVGVTDYSTIAFNCQ